MTLQGRIFHALEMVQNYAGLKGKYFVRNVL